jgi:hypothetical protein
MHPSNKNNIVTATYPSKELPRISLFNFEAYAARKRTTIYKVIDTSSFIRPFATVPLIEEVKDNQLVALSKDISQMRGFQTRSANERTKKMSTEEKQTLQLPPKIDMKRSKKNAPIPVSFAQQSREFDASGFKKKNRQKIKHPAVDWNSLLTIVLPI